MLFFLIEQETVTITLKVRIFYLLAKFFALAFVVFGFLAAAGTVAAVALEPLKNRLDKFLVLI